MSCPWSALLRIPIQRKKPNTENSPRNRVGGEYPDQEAGPSFWNINETTKNNQAYKEN